jgi:hypothetical protein
MALPDHVYHLAEASNWPFIRTEGLLSASKLMERAGLSAEQRTQLENTQRQEHTALPNGVHVRDQRPMPPSALANCLQGMTPRQWYALINSRVFFWLDPDRLNRQRAACGARAQVVLTIDVAQLIQSHRSRAAVTPINTGNARRKPALRGEATFVPVQEFLERGWAREAEALGITERKRSHRPVELTVRDAVPDIMKFVLRVDQLKAGQSFMPK